MPPVRWSAGGPSIKLSRLPYLVELANLEIYLKVDIELGRLWFLPPGQSILNVFSVTLSVLVNLSFSCFSSSRSNCFRC